MKPIQAGLYVLAALTCLACAVLLGREYRRSRVRLLLWSTFCFGLLTINNVLLVIDLAVFPTDIDLRIPRLLFSLAGMLCLLYGFWGIRQPPVDPMIEFLSGAVALAYLVAGAYFLRFWRASRDRLFLSFALAFWLLALNQIIVALLADGDERSGYAYVLRVIGFGFILYAIIRKNLGTRGTGEAS